MTHQERFAAARKTTTLEPHGLVPAHIAYSVRVVSFGEAHIVDGPYFTREEAQIAAETLRKQCRSAKVEDTIYQDHPAITPKLILDCRASRARLQDSLETHA